MKLLGARVIPVSFGLRMLKEAVDSCFQACMQDPVTQLYCIGSVVGPHPFPMMVRVEPLGRGTAVGDYAATMTYGREGVLHGFNSYVLQGEQGQPSPVYSIASGLDYPSVGPEHAFLKDSGRVKYVIATDREVVEAFYMLSRLEGIIPALESAHALAHAIRLSRAEPKQPRSILVNLSGRGDKDMDYVIEHYGTGEGFEAQAYASGNRVRILCPFVAIIATFTP